MAPLFAPTFRVGTPLGLTSAVFLAFSACSPRLYTHAEPYTAGLRIEYPAVTFTFSKPWVLYCAAQAQRHYLHDQQVQTDIQKLAQLFAADTTRLVVVPKSVTNATVSPYLLVGYIDALLLRQRKFCALDTQTGHYLPWVKFVWRRNAEDAWHALHTPDGRVLYITTH